MLFKDLYQNIKDSFSNYKEICVPSITRTFTK